MSVTAELQIVPRHPDPTVFRSSASQGLLVVPVKGLCSSCNLRQICFPCGLAEDEIGRIEALSLLRRKIKRSESLYHMNEPFHALHVVRTGSFKTRLLTEDAREQVTGFQMAGEIIGMDGIGTDVHTCDAIALEDSEVCSIPFVELERLSAEIQSFQRYLHKIMGREIVREHDAMVVLGQMRSEERVAVFLLNLSRHFAARGYSSSEFNLRMSREEIGSYLGLKLETVSRSLSKLQEESLVEVHQRHIRIVDFDRLKCALHSR